MLVLNGSLLLQPAHADLLLVFTGALLLQPSPADLVLVLVGFLLLQSSPPLQPGSESGLPLLAASKTPLRLRHQIWLMKMGSPGQFRRVALTQGQF